MVEHREGNVQLVGTVTLAELGLLFGLLNRAGMTQIEARFCMEMQDKLRSMVGSAAEQEMKKNGLQRGPGTDPPTPNPAG